MKVSNPTVSISTATTENLSSENVKTTPSNNKAYRGHFINFARQSLRQSFRAPFSRRDSTAACKNHRHTEHVIMPDIVKASATPTPDNQEAIIDYELLRAVDINLKQHLTSLNEACDDLVDKLSHKGPTENATKELTAFLNTHNNTLRTVVVLLRGVATNTLANTLLKQQANDLLDRHIAKKDSSGTGSFKEYSYLNSVTSITQISAQELNEAAQNIRQLSRDIENDFLPQVVADLPQVTDKAKASSIKNDLVPAMRRHITTLFDDTAPAMSLSKVIRFAQNAQQCLLKFRQQFPDSHKLEGAQEKLDFVVDLMKNAVKEMPLDSLEQGLTQLKAHQQNNRVCAVLDFISKELSQYAKTSNHGNDGNEPAQFANLSLGAINYQHSLMGVIDQQIGSDLDAERKPVEIPWEEIYSYKELSRNEKRTLTEFGVMAWLKPSTTVFYVE